MGWFFFLLELGFIFVMLSLLLLFIFYLNLAWSWGQSSARKNLGLREILAAAAIEWGATLSVAASHLKTIRRFHETPPIDSDTISTPHQLPILFVPSFNTGPSVFFFLFWRLKKNYWKSLWPFRWKSFLKDPILLADQLASEIESVVKRTGTKRFRIISFGGSRPLVSYVLSQRQFSAYCDKWIAVSAPESRGPVQNLITSEKQKAVFENLPAHQPIQPDLLIVGANDLFCYPESVWGDCRRIEVADVGHYGVCLHSATTQSIMKEMNEK